SAAAHGAAVGLADHGDRRLTAARERWTAAVRRRPEVLPAARQPARTGPDRRARGVEHPADRVRHGDAPDGRSRARRDAHALRPREARRLGRRAGRGADGRSGGPRDLGHLRARLRLGRRGRDPRGPLQPEDRPADGAPARSQGVRRRGARRDRQHTGRDGRGAPARRGRDVRVGLSLEHLPRRDRLRDPDRDPALPADRPVRHRPGREGMKRAARGAVVLAAAVVVLGLVDAVLPRLLNTYYLTILARIAVAVLAAVSLQLVNGFTGQFSIGHAGFMAVGAYTGAALSVYTGAPLLAALPPFMPAALAPPPYFPFPLLAGGIAASFAGLLVGIPALRLRGDYLAIATLGFGEIIRIAILNIDAVGGARGFSLSVQSGVELRYESLGAIAGVVAL